MLNVFEDQIKVAASLKISVGNFLSLLFTYTVFDNQLVHDFEISMLV